jgi:predicted dehydrogenase
MGRLDLSRARTRHALWARVASRLAAVGARLFLRLPDGVIAALLGAGVTAARLLGMEEQRLQIGDVQGIFAEDPEGARALRRLILEGRDGQILAFLRGALRHHVGAADAGRIVVAGPYLRAKRPLNRTVRVALVGDDPELNALGRAYKGCDGIEVADDVDRADAIEVGVSAEAVVERVGEALAAGRSVSVHHAAVPSAEVLGQWLAEANGSGATVRVLVPVLHYAPVQRVRELIAVGEIGEVATVRVRATLARPLDGPSPAPPQKSWLVHPAFDHLALLVALGGPVHGLTAYLGDMRPDGGQGLVACRYAHPGRYGLLECAWSPEFAVPTALLPYDLEAEIAGSDGIVWLRRGMARRTLEAPVAVRVGRSAYTLGVESGVPDRWGQVYRRAARELRDALRKGYHPLLAPSDLLAAFRARDAALRAADHPGVLEV